MLKGMSTQTVCKHLDGKCELKEGMLCSGIFMILFFWKLRSCKNCCLHCKNQMAGHTKFLWEKIPDAPKNMQKLKKTSVLNCNSVHLLCSPFPSCRKALLLHIILHWCSLPFFCFYVCGLQSSYTTWI